MSHTDPTRHASPALGTPARGSDGGGHPVRVRAGRIAFLRQWCGMWSAERRGNAQGRVQGLLPQTRPEQPETPPTADRSESLK